MNPIERKRVRDEVKACTSCDLRQRCSSPVPFSGPSSPRLVVVGESPQADDGEIFSGPAKDLLDEWLHDAGWNVDEIAFVDAVSCWPNRTPTKDEVNACQKNLAQQLVHLDCGYLLVLGGISVAALCNTEVRMGEIRGLWWRPDRIVLPRETWAVSTWHPTAVLRNSTLGFEAFDDVSYMSLMIQREITPARGSFCVKCRMDAVDFSTDIPYCARHLPKGKK